MGKKIINKSSNDNFYNDPLSEQDNIGVSSNEKSSIADVVMLKQQKFTWFSGKRGENPECFLQQFEEILDEKFSSDVLARIATEKLNDPAKSLVKKFNKNNTITLRELRTFLLDFFPYIPYTGSIEGVYRRIVRGSKRNEGLLLL